MKNAISVPTGRSIKEAARSAFFNSVLLLVIGACRTALVPVLAETTTIPVARGSLPWKRVSAMPYGFRSVVTNKNRRAAVAIFGGCVSPESWKILCHGQDRGSLLFIENLTVLFTPLFVFLLSFIQRA